MDCEWLVVEVNKDWVNVWKTGPNIKRTKPKFFQISIQFVECQEKDIILVEKLSKIFNIQAFLIKQDLVITALPLLPPIQPGSAQQQQVGGRFCCYYCKGVLTIMVSNEPRSVCVFVWCVCVCVCQNLDFCLVFTRGKILIPFNFKFYMCLRSENEVCGNFNMKMKSMVNLIT